MCLSVLSRSHDVEEKVQAINTFLVHLDCVYDSVDFFTDVSALSKHQLAHILRLMDEIEGQLLRLRKYLNEAGEVQKD